MSVSILGIGIVSALGCGISSLKEGLEGTISPVVTEEIIQIPSGEMSMPIYRAEINGLDRFISPQKLRRINRFIRMSMLSSFLAIEDSGITIKDKTKVGIAFGSGYGPHKTTFDFLDSLIDYGDKCASPTLFASSVHNAMASQVSISLGIKGPCSTLTCFEHTTASVFSLAESWLNEGDSDYVLAGVGDEHCPVRNYAAALSCSGKIIKPFIFDECTYLPGEGFVTFMLGKDFTKNSYARLTKVETGKGLPYTSNGPDHLFLAANGEKAKGNSYRSLKGNSLFAYSPLYGGMPSGSGFDLAIAALSLKEGKLYRGSKSSGIFTASINAEKKALLKGSSIGCIEYDGSNNFSIVSLSK